MGMRVGVLFLLVLGISWTCADARSLAISDLTVMQMNHQESKSKIPASEVVVSNENVCTLCEQFTSQALYYLGENKTQAEIIDTLHQACSKLHSFNQECIRLVDYYAPLFFLEIAVIQPELFCKKVNLCGQIVIVSAEQSQDSCALCHQAVEEVLVKLKDPDIQLEIIEMLLKGCDSVDYFKKECKKLVFEYGPIMLDGAEQFLETKDLCTTLRVCKSSSPGREEDSSSVKISLLSEA